MSQLETIIAQIRDDTNGKFTGLSEDLHRKIYEFVESFNLESALTESGDSLILQLVPRGCRDLAKKLGSRVAKLDIFEASAIGNLESVKAHIDLDKTLVSAKSKFEGMTPLHLACGFSDSLETVKYLLDHGADINAISEGKNIDDMPPIIAATLGRNLQILEYLLERGADASSQEVNTGVTPVHIAVFNNRIEQVKLLMKWGANPNVGVFGEAEVGRTPIDTAKKKGYLDILEILNTD